jgi:hypothetical protein
MKSIVQHDAYERLESEAFDPAYVGNECRGRGWRTADDGS